MVASYRGKHSAPGRLPRQRRPNERRLVHLSIGASPPSPPLSFCIFESPRGHFKMISLLTRGCFAKGGKKRFPNSVAMWSFWTPYLNRVLVGFYRVLYCFYGDYRVLLGFTAFHCFFLYFTAFYCIISHCTVFIPGYTFFLVFIGSYLFLPFSFKSFELFFM